MPGGNVVVRGSAPAQQSANRRLARKHLSLAGLCTLVGVFAGRDTTTQSILGAVAINVVSDLIVSIDYGFGLDKLKAVSRHLRSERLRSYVDRTQARNGPPTTKALGQVVVVATLVFAVTVAAFVFGRATAADSFVLESVPDGPTTSTTEVAASAVDDTADPTLQVTTSEATSSTAGETTGTTRLNQTVRDLEAASSSVPAAGATTSLSPSTTVASATNRSSTTIKPVSSEASSTSQDPVDTERTVEIVPDDDTEPTSEPEPEPEPVPEPATEPEPPPLPLSAALTESPFRCDNATRTAATISNATPGEQITLTSPQATGLATLTANGSGQAGIGWQCSPYGNVWSWQITATGTTSGRSTTFSITGAAPQPTLVLGRGGVAGACSPQCRYVHGSGSWWPPGEQYWIRCANFINTTSSNFRLRYVNADGTFSFGDRICYSNYSHEVEVWTVSGVRVTGTVAAP